MLSSDSKPKIILTAVKALCETMTTAGGYHHDSSGRTYFARADFDYQPSAAAEFPLWSVFGVRGDLVAARLTGQHDFRMLCGIEAQAVPDDMDNPALTAMDLAGDLVRLVREWTPETLLPPAFGGSWYHFLNRQGFADGCQIVLDDSFGWAIDTPEAGETLCAARVAFSVHYREF
jgi:hypothetical protein